ncbi:MAG: NRAMP family divalent metal transporter [Streptosporangiaceae bacterium]
MLDEAHLGDIEGALGRIKVSEDHRGGWRRRLVTFLAIVGPGLIVMVGDNDAGGVSTYAQAGQDYGYSLLWVLLLLIPVLIVNQEMVVRLGAVTGVGHARLINERFGRFWGWFSVGDLFLLNFLTIVTEFIGISLAMSYFGVSPDISVPVAAALLVAITASGSFRRWERAMFLFIGASLVLFLPLIFFVHPHVGTIAHDFVGPGISGGISSDAVLLIIAIVGTTVAPWQLFFQQSNVIDKRITTRWLRYEVADTSIGAVLTTAGAAALMVATAFGLSHSGAATSFGSGLTVARALGHQAGSPAGAIFAVVLVNASVIGASAVTLATSYALGDIFGMRHSLHRSVRDARGFYVTFAGLIALAAAVVLIPGAPLGLMTTAVQVLAGVLLPSAIVFLLLLCNDRAVLGPWVNSLRQNLVAGVIVAALVLLSLILTVTTVLPKLPLGPFAAGCAAAGLIGVGGFGLASARSRPKSAPAAARGSEQRHTWRMPPLATMAPPTWSRAQRIGMYLLRGYLVLAVVLLAVKVAQLAGGH